MAGVADGVARGEPVAMYESDEQRDADIVELAEADGAELRDRLLAATTAFGDAVEEVADDRWDGGFSRTPGGEPWPAATIVATRRRELEIHHVDLGAAYSQQDWPDDFVDELLDVVSVDQAGAGPFRIRATDLGRDWVVGGEGGPVVTGTRRGPRLVADRPRRRRRAHQRQRCTASARTVAAGIGHHAVLRTTSPRFPALP